MDGGTLLRSCGTVDGKGEGAAADGGLAGGIVAKVRAGVAWACASMVVLADEGIAEEHEEDRQREREGLGDALHDLPGEGLAHGVYELQSIDLRIFSTSAPHASSLPAGTNAR
jgi:hypothetical protein